MTERMGNADDDVEEPDEFEDIDTDVDEEEDSDVEEEAEETKTETKRESRPRAEKPKVQEVRQEKVAHTQPVASAAIDSDAVEMFNQCKQSALLLGVDEKKAEAYAASQALMFKAQLDKVKSRVEQAEDERFNQTEYGEAMRQLKKAIPSLTKQQVKEFVDFKNQALMEGSYRAQAEESTRLSADEKHLAKLWGIKPEDMKKELRRYDKVMSMDMPSDNHRIYELGRIPV